MAFLSDIEIAQQCRMKKIGEIADKLSISDEYIEQYGKYKAKTSHTLNPVPCIIYDNTDAKNSYTVKADGKFGLSNVAATTVNLLGYKAPEMWDDSIIEVK